MRLCPAPGCHEPVQTGRCQAHARRPAEDRPSAASRGYGRRWQRYRQYVLARHPLCVDCEAAGRLTIATELHHPHRLRDGGPLITDDVMPLCQRCHATRTGRGE